MRIQHLLGEHGYNPHHHMPVPYEYAARSDFFRAVIEDRESPYRPCDHRFAVVTGFGSWCSGCEQFVDISGYVLVN